LSVEHRKSSVEVLQTKRAEVVALLESAINARRGHLSLPASPPNAQSPKLTPGAKAIAAALDLKREGTPVSLKAACDRAKVDRKNVRERYPDAVKAIKALAAPDGSPRRGFRDRRTGSSDVMDEADE
jgi:hypothetical protein